MSTLQIVDIETLNELNPLSFGEYYNKKLVQKIKKKFASKSQKLFITVLYKSFVEEYNSEYAFVVKLDDIWNLIGCRNKKKCLDILKDCYSKENEYCVDTSQENSPIYLRLNAFEELCTLVQTEKGEDNRLYMRTLEKIFEDVIHSYQKEILVNLKVKLLQIEENYLKQNGLKFEKTDMKLKYIRLENEKRFLEQAIQNIRNAC